MATSRRLEWLADPALAESCASSKEQADRNVLEKILQIGIVLLERFLQLLVIRDIVKAIDGSLASWKGWVLPSYGARQYRHEGNVPLWNNTAAAGSLPRST